MGNKIFVSYKYHDDSVYPLRQGNAEFLHPTIVRDYVDIIERKLEMSPHVYKGESDNQDLSYLSDNDIWELLKDRIYDSSITIVVISPNMREKNKSDRAQWIPWEIAYSLRETTRGDRTSHSNAIFGVVLPDKTGWYDYFFNENHCTYCRFKYWDCADYHLENTFNIIKKNINNSKNIENGFCDNRVDINLRRNSYLQLFTWEYFIHNMQDCINCAHTMKANIDRFNICKEV